MGRRKLVWLEIARPSVTVIASASVANTPPWTRPSGWRRASVTSSRARTSSSLRSVICMASNAATSTRLGRKMPSATAFERLAPDQRAAVELVLRQGRSYGELAELLGMPEETIRARARNGVAALAPDLPAPPRAGEI